MINNQKNVIKNKKINKNALSFKGFSAYNGSVKRKISMNLFAWLLVAASSVIASEAAFWPNVLSAIDPSVAFTSVVASLAF